MMKKIVFACLVLCLSLTSLALAGGPSGGLRGIRMPEVIGRGSGISVSGPNSIYTGAETTWTVTDRTGESGNTYSYAVGKDDHSFLDENTLDLQYIEEGSSSAAFTWTCYDPGEYCLFVDAYDSDGNNVGWDQVAFSVTLNPSGDALRTRVSQIASQCRASSEYQTALNIYDWLIDNMEYDYTYTHYTAADGILDGCGVCNSYAKSFTLIAGACGLEASRVTGVVRDDYGERDENGGHAWNVCRVDGQWYKLDATWDDGWSHMYFLVDDDLIEVEHYKYKTDIGDVVCSSMDANYYVSEGLWGDMAGTPVEGAQAALDLGDHTYTFAVDSLIDGDDDSRSVMYLRHLSGKIAQAVMKTYDYEWADGTALTAPDYSRTVTYAMDGSDIYTLGIRFDTVRTLTLPGGTLSVEEETFRNTSAHMIYIPDGCTSIGDYAFAGMPLWEVHIPSSVTSLGEHALEDAVTDRFLIYTDSDYVRDFASEHGYLLGE